MRDAAHHLLKLLALTLLPLSCQGHPPPAATAPQPQQTEASPPATSRTLTIAANKNATQQQNSADDELAQLVARAIQQGNFAEAYHLWRPLADDGDAAAQYGIGWMYHNGYGLAINDEEAIRWWERAATQGHIDATFALGMLYALGEGSIQRDMARAVSYYHRAAKVGHEDARLLLRTLIIEGDTEARKLMLTLLDEGRQHEIGTPATVSRPRANVRLGPGNRHKRVTSLRRGHELVSLQRQGRWLLVGIAGRTSTGWIHDSLVNIGIQSNP